MIVIVKVSIIHDNNLQGSIPFELSLLTDLHILDLSQNPGIAGRLPAAMFEE